MCAMMDWRHVEQNSFNYSQCNFVLFWFYMDVEGAGNKTDSSMVGTIGWYDTEENDCCGACASPSSKQY